VAPLALTWLSDPRVIAKAPAHLDERPRTLQADGAMSLPRGSLVTVVGQARHDGRPLVLTDGGRQIPFLDDGRGAVSARWTVRHDAELRIAARFGDTLILQPGGLALYAVADLPPVIRLDGAPKTIALLDQPEVSLRYHALDDHGLTEVSLVLRAGVREQRRSLSQLRGASRSAQGALVLRMDDEFVEQSFLPVEATVEARDNDGFLGPKWGRSQPIVIVPPRVGERQALRYAAVEAMRDALTDLLATRLRASESRTPGQTTAWTHDEARHKETLTAVETLLARRFGGLRLSGTVRALVRGQLERLDAAWLTAHKTPAVGTRRKLISATESAVLAVDAMLAAVGDRDGRTSAR
jgi:hypothetical protein